MKPYLFNTFRFLRALRVSTVNSFLIALFAIAVMFTLVACQEYRIEHRRLPSYYWQASDGEIPERITLEDGTVIVQQPARFHTDGDPLNRDPSEASSRLRQETDDGRVTLRPRDPEDVLRLLIHCLHNEEYDLIYTQLLSEPTRERWEEQGRTIDDFVAYFMRNRRDLVRTLQRLHFGLGQNETYTVWLDQNLVEFQLNPQISEGMKFRRVRVLIEPEGSRLVVIR